MLLEYNNNNNQRRRNEENNQSVNSDNESYQTETNQVSFRYVLEWEPNKKVS